MAPPTRCRRRIWGLVALGVAAALLVRWRARRLADAEAALGIGPYRASGTQVT